MAKQRPPRQKQSLESSPSPQNPSEQKLHSLLEQKKYRQALDEVQKIRRSHPDFNLTPSEGEIWRLRARQELEKNDFKQAESSFRRALQLGCGGDTYYWLAKCLLSLNRLDTAIDLLRNAFEKGDLPKEYSICYPKTLLLKGDTATVQDLIDRQGQRFSAAQLHWLRGVLSLQQGNTHKALVEFLKIKKPLTPGDRPDIWQIYLEQALERWEVTANRLDLKREEEDYWRFHLKSPKYNEHPLLQRLALLQKLKTGQPRAREMRFPQGDRQIEESLKIAALLEYLDENDHHSAGQVLLQLDSRSGRSPELAAIRPALLTLAGEQARRQGDLDRVEIFWKTLLDESGFDPRLAVNLLEIFDANDSYRESQRLLTRLIKWLERTASKDTANWPKERLDRTLASAHCRLADTWMALDRPRTAFQEVQQAERIDPRAPEVIGRRGLMAYLDDNYQEAIELLTAAIEGGCRQEEVYRRLIDSWREIGDPEAAKEARRRFGKYFDDRVPEFEVNIPPWVDALATGSYPMFQRLVTTVKSADPALSACRIFVGATRGTPTSGGRVSLDQEQATSAWDDLLKNLSEAERSDTLQAIALSLLLFAKREKGIAGLITKYQLQLFDFGAVHPPARQAYQVILAVKERNPEKLRSPLSFYLDSVPQPGDALARIQLQARRYQQSPVLRSFLDAALEREPQNPLLLLAKATTYPVSHADYEKFKQAGFEIARRLQDAKALQAFREEEGWLKARDLQEILPDPDVLDDLDASGIDEFLERLFRKIAGDKIPPAEFQRALPEFKRMMLDDMVDFDGDFDEDDEEETGFPFGFGRKSGSRSNRSRQRRRR